MSSSVPAGSHSPSPTSSTVRHGAASHLSPKHANTMTLTSGPVALATWTSACRQVYSFDRRPASTLSAKIASSAGLRARHHPPRGVGQQQRIVLVRARREREHRQRQGDQRQRRRHAQHNVAPVAVRGATSTFARPMAPVTRPTRVSEPVVRNTQFAMSEPPNTERDSEAKNVNPFSAFQNTTSYQEGATQ